VLLLFLIFGLGTDPISFTTHVVVVVVAGATVCKKKPKAPSFHI